MLSNEVLRNWVHELVVGSVRAGFALGSRRVGAGFQLVRAWNSRPKFKRVGSEARREPLYVSSQQIILTQESFTATRCNESSRRLAFANIGRSSPVKVARGSSTPGLARDGLLLASQDLVDFGLPLIG
ncbi:hypothetical protein TorRG33x02_198960 [Trema orientale]|uniref:Uncharacterized protein n=1 Tax=Trema orientale TaxID=63057 RepID=A0A2P5EFL6_TREOI|nr:hypothetical protein TorRG33x02_198960 [Trema orientale]